LPSSRPASPEALFVESENQHNCLKSLVKWTTQLTNSAKTKTRIVEIDKRSRESLSKSTSRQAGRPSDVSLLSSALALMAAGRCFDHPREPSVLRTGGSPPPP